MLLGTLLSLAMLTQTDKAALQSSKLPPNANNNIAAIAGTRGVVLAKASLATYVGPTGPQTVLSYLIPPNTLQVGDCFRWQIGGFGNNADAAPRSFGAQLRITQAGATSQTFGYVVLGVPSVPADDFMWSSEGLVCVGIAGATGQYLAGGGSRLSSSYSASPQAGRNLPNASLGFTGYGKTFITSATLAPPTDAAGPFLTASGGQANTTQFLFSGGQPIVIEIFVTQLTTSNTSLTVNAGVLEGL